MRLTVRVRARAKRTQVTQAADGSILVEVTEPAAGGRANAAVIAALARHFDVPQQAVTIVRGRTSRHKVVEIAS